MRAHIVHAHAHPMRTCAFVCVGIGVGGASVPVSMYERVHISKRGPVQVISLRAHVCESPLRVTVC